MDSKIGEIQGAKLCQQNYDEIVSSSIILSGFFSLG